MARPVVHLDHAQIGQWLRTSPEVREGITAAAETIAAASGIKDTRIETDVSDRFRALVIAKNRRRGDKASDELGGKLIAAASSAGLDVKRR